MIPSGASARVTALHEFLQHAQPFMLFSSIMYWTDDYITTGRNQRYENNCNELTLISALATEFRITHLTTILQ